MKKILFMAAALFLVPMLSQAAQYKEGVHYTVIHDGAETAKPEIKEYFSFLCGHCFNFYQTVLPKLKKGLPEGVTFKQSHVDFLGGKVGVELTKAFAVAYQLNISAKMEKAFFNAIHVQRKRLVSADDIRQVFISNGVDAKKYDAAASSFMVNAQAKKMGQDARKAKVTGVPDLVVNGKYRIEKGAIKSWDDYLAIAFYLAKK
ncbi:thiol:disulfide interchange protein DsbA/DsbL [Parashewanella spongiae]|uniref:Thiol:disulfide interchange protein n=1 Tax=Parashewanella spongiae TaxID=342950 RepID=A0A3A6UKQ0_9GAMM|nr:thiol:disulfide interchange protein DsbA/DsbL [Parashewanella spongiae]MCL1077756.1 thiol:disulfide interchange protein DsbA/DsbL [Parashewanella spongiae]RJY18155.1 thiol:disulfide interchange protein DsbA/DsbL [Parashewanella spongiae]